MSNYPLAVSLAIDTVVVSHPVQVGVIGILEKALSNDHAYLPPAVVTELQAHSKSSPATHQVWLRRPTDVLIDPFNKEDKEQINLFLEELGSEDDNEHLGEAECLVLAQKMGGYIVTDDRDALIVAGCHNVNAYATPDILDRGIEHRLISTNAASDYIDQIKSVLDENGNPKFKAIKYCNGESFLQDYGYES